MNETTRTKIIRNYIDIAQKQNLKLTSNITVMNGFELTQCKK